MDRKARALAIDVATGIAGGAAGGFAIIWLGSLARDQMIFTDMAAIVGATIFTEGPRLIAGFWRLLAKGLNQILHTLLLQSLEPLDYSGEPATADQDVVTTRLPRFQDAPDVCSSRPPPGTDGERQSSVRDALSYHLCGTR